jgi:uncharacterized Ntn-hydrolase superfamily protein
MQWWDRLDRGGKLISAIVGLGAIGGAIVGGMVSLAHSAAADVVHPVEHDVTELKAVVPMIRDDARETRDEMRRLFEVERQRLWLDHRIVIPDPTTPRDGGTR